MLSFMICEGLEADIYTIRLISEDWYVVEKIKDISNKQPLMNSFLMKNLWVDPYKGESTDTDDDK